MSKSVRNSSAFLYLFLFLPFLVLISLHLSHCMLDKVGTDFYEEYMFFPESRRLEMMEEAKKMFYFGYDNYMNFAFPLDELNPILCTGRGPDYKNP